MTRGERAGARAGVRATFFLFIFATEVHARVVDFHSDIRIAKSGELTVTERITVELKAKSPGLERDLPQGSRIVDVIRNGHPEPYTLEDSRLRVGKEPLPPGRHLYQIAYRSTRNVLFPDGGYDELHWKLAAAERVTAEVTLPARVPARDIRARADGEYQSFIRDGRVAFRSTQPVTIVVRFPKDVVTAPALGQRLRWLFDDYKGLLAVLGIVGVAAAVLWRLRILSARA